MESDGPYTIKNKNYWWNVDGLGEEQRLNQWAYKIGAEWWASKLNAAHAEGRKSMEKELEELYKIASELCIERNNLYGFETDGILDFAAYKKLRGIE